MRVDPRFERVALSNGLARVLGFLRVGYPDGVPHADQVPLLALLRRRLSDDEVVALAEELAATGAPPVDGTDIRVATKLTNAMPSAEDTDRVTKLLIGAGWPVSEPFDLPG
jgi:Protein of unknown function (DUF3349)